MWMNASSASSFRNAVVLPVIISSSVPALDLLPSAGHSSGIPAMRHPSAKRSPISAGHGLASLNQATEQSGRRRSGRSQSNTRLEHRPVDRSGLISARARRSLALLHARLGPPAAKRDRHELTLGSG